MKIYNDTASLLLKQVAEFKRGRTSTDNDPREGRPKTTTNQENIEKKLYVSRGSAFKSK